ncbi:MAG: hypothetical protein FP825_11030 [Hyphomonas sp.]|uniref:hypothetical protein n=1 Tax=Hyphomonas sp. TaxID=87 RepID=UPI0017AB85A1|nr:hypothetical protein [Hyphomonas sp.]MBA3069003.1 hypothetical protein [Hyphomonas sp.]MBU3921427.1 hypothetical protein [Alphaproteobacteria bacterium]MBU4061636.1 hypothetical protein [Alphaproteobacteria bacterium]MBU4163481.1 hypothetical protein [Alphaproteobacteria bacterium]
MTAPEFRSGWYPVMRSAALKRAPVQRTLAGTALQLSRASGGGLVATEPGTGHPRLAAEQDGWIFAAIGEAAPGPVSERPLIHSASQQLQIEGTVRAGLGDVGENILDTTHTSVVHRDYLRRPGERRRIDAVLASGEEWVSATYPQGAAPGGWGARLLGAHRYAITDTFRAPAIAEVSYMEMREPVFAARFWLTPVSDRETYVAATLAVPGTGWAARLKLAALRLFFLRIFAEDRAILEMIDINRSAHGAAPLVFAPQDLLRPGINAILDGRRPLASDTHIALKI